MSGFIVQIAALVYLLVFIYSRQSSAASMDAGVLSPSSLEICYKVYQWLIYLMTRTILTITVSHFFQPSNVSDFVQIS